MLDPAASRLRYLAEGVAAVPGILAPAALAELRAAVEEIVAQAPKDVAEVTPYRADDGTQAVAYPGGYYIEHLSSRAPLLADLLAGSPLPALACELLGCDEVAFWRDEIHYKSPRHAANATPWHHGAASFPFKGRDALTIWLPLTEVGDDDGPLLTVAGTQADTHLRYRPPTRDVAADDDGGLYRPIPDFDALAAAGACRIDRWTMAAGSALGFHPYLVHGSAPNRGGRARIAYVSRWLGPDARYAPDAYSVAEADVGTLRDGIPDRLPRFRRVA